MIRLQDLTPEVYYKQSRDFQLFGRLYDLILNSALTNAEVMYNLPLNSDTDQQLLELISLTLGFNSKHKYNNQQLVAICSIFSEILRTKGSEQAVQLAANALLRAENISEEANVKVSVDTNTNITTLEVWLPEKLSDMTLFYDLLDYILPAGVSCTIYRGTFRKAEAKTELCSVDEANVWKYGDTYRDGKSIKSLTEMSKIVKPDSTMPDSTMEKRQQNNKVLTTTNMTGYLDNMIIPKIKQEEK